MFWADSIIRDNSASMFYWTFVQNKKCSITSIMHSSIAYICHVIYLVGIITGGIRRSWIQRKYFGGGHSIHSKVHEIHQVPGEVLLQIENGKISAVDAEGNDSPREK